jgi:two-component system NtrC family sensor kinase
LLDFALPVRRITRKGSGVRRLIGAKARNNILAWALLEESQKLHHCIALREPFMLSFRTQARRLVFLGMILVPVLPILVIMLLGDWTMNKIIRHAAQAQMERIAEDHATMIDSFLDERLGDLQFALDVCNKTQLAEQENLARLLKKFQRLGTGVQDLGFITPDGVQRAYAGPFDLRGRNYSGSDWRNRALSKGVFVSDVYLGYRAQPHFTAAVRDHDGDVLRATIDSDAFGLLVESLQLGRKGQAYVVNSLGVLQTRSRSGPGLLEKDPASGLYPAGSSRTVSVTADTGQGEDLFTVSPINYGRWRLVVRQPLGDAIGELATVRLYALAVLALGGVLMIPSALLLSRRVGHMLGVAERRSRDLEDQLARAARLAELGTMTAGFAHEINNPLQVMSSDISLLEMVLNDTTLSDKPAGEPDKEELRGVVQQLRLQISRCAQITQAILKFGRREQTRDETIHLETYLQEAAAMVRRKAQVYGVDFTVDAAAQTPDIHADPGKLQQVILNLMNNAIHAIVDRHGSEGGRLELRAEPGRPGEVLIRVRDNGSGMSKDTMSMIFTPFFTTKPSDQGTGLGLSLCYGLVESMGGSIQVDSKLGEGSEFILRLPAVGA